MGVSAVLDVSSFLFFFFSFLSNNHSLLDLWLVNFTKCTLCGMRAWFQGEGVGGGGTQVKVKSKCCCHVFACRYSGADIEKLRKWALLLCLDCTLYQRQHYTKRRSTEEEHSSAKHLEEITPTFQCAVLGKWALTFSPNTKLLFHFTSMPNLYAGFNLQIAWWVRIKLGENRRADGTQCFIGEG